MFSFVSNCSAFVFSYKYKICKIRVYYYIFRSNYIIYFWQDWNCDSLRASQFIVNFQFQPQCKLTHARSFFLSSYNKRAIHRKKKMAAGTFSHTHENLNNFHKNVPKHYKMFNWLRQLNVLMFLVQEDNIAVWLSLYLIDCVSFARHCGKMYSRHPFSCGGV